MMSTRSPSSVGSARGPDFMQSMERADKRHKKLLMMQKKIQVGDAMQKKMRMERSLSPVKGGRISTPDIIKTVNAELDTMITMDDFQKCALRSPARRRAPAPHAPQRAAAHFGGHVAQVDAVEGPARAVAAVPVAHAAAEPGAAHYCVRDPKLPLPARADGRDGASPPPPSRSSFWDQDARHLLTCVCSFAGAQERSGKIKRKSTERRRKKRASKVRIGGTAGTSPAAEPRPVSLPNLESPARAASQRSSSVASRQTPEVSRSNASTASRHMPELSQSTKKRHQHAEVRRRPLLACRWQALTRVPAQMMIRQQVRNQAKDLSYTFKRADADGSGELDEDEVNARAPLPLRLLRPR